MGGELRARRRRPSGIDTWTAVLAVPLVLSLFLAPPAGADPLPFRKGPYRNGQTVKIQGRVADAAGNGVARVSVLLEVSRDAFRLKKLRRETGQTLQVPAAADEQGRFDLDWRWDPYYNVFSLVVALPVRQAGRETYEEFYRLEITRQLTGANPLAVRLVLPDTAALNELRAFLDSVESEDEKRVYREMGRPDRVDTAQAHYDPDRSWWYFTAGKVYRFRDGKVEQEVRFDPVSSLPDP